MKFSMFILLSLILTAWAKDPNVLKIKSKDSEFSLQLKDKVWVSDSCIKSECQALKKVEIKKSKSKNGLAGHPAADFCEEEGGNYVIGKRVSGDEDGVCVFKDKSYILGWDYYKRNQKVSQ